MLSADNSLTEYGDATDDVAYQFLTIGVRQAQEWMLRNGYSGWRKRSSALSFTGADDTDGGQKATLPSDFLRAWSPRSHLFPARKVSALEEANGDLWGQEIYADDRTMQGDYYYILGEELWLARGAKPPGTLYLHFNYVHPVWSASVTIDFPLRARALIPAEAANEAKEEAWLPMGADMELKIERRLASARRAAGNYSRMTRQPKELRRPLRYGNRW